MSDPYAQLRSAFLPEGDNLPWTPENEARVAANSYVNGLASMLPQTWGDVARKAPYWVPYLGNVLMARDAMQHAAAGEYPQAGLSAAGAFLPGGRLLSGVAGGLTAREIARRELLNMGR